MADRDSRDRDFRRVNIYQVPYYKNNIREGFIQCLSIKEWKVSGILDLRNARLPGKQSGAFDQRYLYVIRTGRLIKIDHTTRLEVRLLKEKKERRAKAASERFSK